MSKKYESTKGRYHVTINDGVPVLEINGVSLFVIETVQDLIDLFIAVAAVLNQVYDNDRFE